MKKYLKKVPAQDVFLILDSKTTFVYCGDYVILGKRAASGCS
jgi:hypothetical protein